MGQIVQHKHIDVAGVVIAQDQAGRYCLNDLHRAAGGEKRHQPSDFLRATQISELIEELTDPGNPGTLPVESIRGGITQGTFVCKELVYAYAMWISAKFHLQVIRTFDAVATGQQLPTGAELSKMQILELAMESERERLVLTEQLAAAAPAIAFVEKFVDSTGLKGFRQVCKLLNANEAEFRTFLEDKKIMYRLGGEWTPHAQHLGTGRFSVKAGTSDVSGHAFNSARFTAKGVNWVAGEWAKFQLEARTEVAL